MEKKKNVKSVRLKEIIRESEGLYNNWKKRLESEENLQLEMNGKVEKSVEVTEITDDDDDVKSIDDDEALPSASESTFEQFDAMMKGIELGSLQELQSRKMAKEMRRADKNIKKVMITEGDAEKYNIDKILEELGEVRIA